MATVIDLGSGAGQDFQFFDSSSYTASTHDYEGIYFLNTF